MNGNENTQPSGEVAVAEAVQSIVDAEQALTLPVSEGDRVWDSLNFLNRELRAFNLIPGMLIPHVRDREVVEKVENPRENLLAPMQILTNDVTVFRDRLDAIAAKHANRTGSSNSSDEQMAAIQINEEYIQWGAEYETVVTPNVLAMMETLLQAGADVNADKLRVTPSAVIEASFSADAEAGEEIGHA